MMLFREVRPVTMLDCVNVPWLEAMPQLGREVGSAWTIVTPVSDAKSDLSSSRLFKSLQSECNDRGKKQSLLAIVTALKTVSRSENYQEALKDLSGINVKEAYSYKFNGANHKIWEFKYQNKDRLCFATYTERVRSSSSLFILLLYHHNKDKTTPNFVSGYCGDLMRQFLGLNGKYQVLKG